MMPSERVASARAAPPAEATRLARYNEGNTGPGQKREIQVRQQHVTTRFLPELLRPLFWDHDFEQLKWPHHRDLVIARILQRGGDDAIRWLLRTVSEEDLRGWFFRTSGRSLDPRRLRFWQVMLDLPEEQVTRWIEDLQMEPWSRRNG
jgi:hypothetical protein